MSGWDRKREVMRCYNSTAQMYDMRYAEEQKAKFEEALKILNIERHDLVLDAGCGTGLFFGYIASKAETIVGLDISRKILLLAKERAKKLQNIHLILADTDYTPLKRNIFNYVFAFTLIQNMPNPVKTLNEIEQVASSNAFIVVSGLKKAFAKEKFEELLQTAGLKIVSLKELDLKCYVAVCKPANGGRTCLISLRDR